MGPARRIVVPRGPGPASGAAGIAGGATEGEPAAGRVVAASVAPAPESAIVDPGFACRASLRRFDLGSAGRATSGTAIPMLITGVPPMAGGHRPQSGGRRGARYPRGADCPGNTRSAGSGRREIPPVVEMAGPDSAAKP
jgi:hypothetical protein